SAGAMLDGARSGEPDGVQGGDALRQGPTVWARSQRREVSRRRSGIQGLRDRGDDSRRHGLCEGIPRRALSARVADRPDRADHAAPDLKLHRREGARLAEVVLIDVTCPGRSAPRSDVLQTRALVTMMATGIPLLRASLRKAAYCTARGTSAAV